MIDALLNNIPFDRYLPVLERLLPEAELALVLDADAFPIWSSDGEDHGSVAGVIREALDDLSREHPHHLVRRDLGLITVAPLASGNGSTYGWLVTVTPLLGEAPDRGTRREAVGEGAAILARMINTEIALTAELNVMADELAERYEELNLVYTTDDQVDDISKGREALQTLVQNCTDFIGVSATALILPEKGMSLISTHSGGAIPQQPQILQTLRERVYPWMRKEGASLVVNGGINTLRARLCPKIAYKLVAAPILLGKDEVVGVLALFNNLRQGDFTNSHRNLVEAMARKAGKIVQASYDSLTGLINIHGFERLMEEALRDSRENGTHHALVNIGIDRLRIVNDISGRKTGDRVIRRVAELIQEAVRDGDPVARLSGDQYGILLRSCPLEKAEEIAHRIARRVRELEIAGEGDPYHLSITTGIVPVGAETESVAYAMSAVELARNAAHERGANQLEVFTENDERLRIRREGMRWVGRIQRALQEDRLLLFAQPIRSVRESDELFHLEILLRMRCENGEILPPGRFMPAAEYYYLMPAIDRWVVRHTLREMEALLPDLDIRAQGHVAINLSGQSLGSDGFLEFLMEAVATSPVPNRWLCFEITESSAVANLEKALHLINVMRGMGCAFSLDDFGTGLSSFAYLRQFDVDYLKIDGSFIKPLVEDPVARSMVSAIHNVGHGMGLKTIAEFVEDDAILSQLRILGVDYGQGYGLGKPEPLRDYFLREVCRHGRKQAG